MRRPAIAGLNARIPLAGVWAAAPAAREDLLGNSPHYSLDKLAVEIVKELTKVDY
jgi:hypothetical protein